MDLFVIHIVQINYQIFRGREEMKVNEVKPNNKIDDNNKEQKYEKSTIYPEWLVT